MSKEDLSKIDSLSAHERALSEQIAQLQDFCRTWTRTRADGQTGGNADTASPLRLAGQKKRKGIHGKAQQR